MYNVLKTTLALQSTFYIAIQFSRLRPISHNLILLPVFQAVKEHHKRCNRWHLQVRASQYQLHKDNPIYSLSDALREVGSALLLLKWRNYERRTVQDKSGPGRSKELWHQTQLSGALICIERGFICDYIRCWKKKQHERTQKAEFYPWKGWAWLLVLQHCRSCTDSRRYQPAMGYHVPISLRASLRGAHCPRMSPHRHTLPAAWTATGRWPAGSWALREWGRGWAGYHPLQVAPDRSRSPWRSRSPGAEWGFQRLEGGPWSGRSPGAGAGVAVKTGLAALSETWTRSDRWSSRAPGFLRCDRGFSL